MKRLLLAILFVLVSCDNLPTGQSPTPSPAPSPPPLEGPVLVRNDAPFMWDTYAGYTGFALGHPGQSDMDVLSLVNEAMGFGWNTVRMCSETEFWDDVYPLIRKPRDIERLKWTLDLIASVPGAQVLLIGDCTLKRQVPLDEAANWARQVADLLREEQYQNVAVETHNEWYICRGRTDWGGSNTFCPGKQNVREHIDIYKSRGISYVTADDRLCRDDFPDKLVFRNENIGAWPADFHYCREYPPGTPWDPRLSQIRQLQRRLGMVLFSETVALGDVTGQCSGLRTCDLGRIQDFVNRCAQVDAEQGEMGCKFTLHTEALLGGDHPGQWPRAK